MHTYIILNIKSSFNASFTFNESTIVKVDTILVVTIPTLRSISKIHIKLFCTRVYYNVII